MFLQFLIGDFNMSLKKITTYISNNFPNWSIAPLYGNQFTYAKGSRSSCIDHVIFNKALAAHINKTSVCTSFHGISDHKPILLSCYKILSDGFMKPAKVSKWSTHICKTKNSDILSHNYFSVLADDLDTHYNTLTADEDDIKAFIPTDLKGSAFHCPFYIKKLSHEKHIAFQNIKPFFNCENVDKYLEQFNKYEKLCKLIKKVKSKFRSARYKANIINIGNYPLNKDFKNDWKSPGPDGIPIEFYKALFCNDELEETHPAAGKCLELIFNKIWNGSFPKKWNSASIVSIPKKGDLTDCSNYRGISLINVGLKIISKIVTDRISKYALSHNFIRPEQFGFRNHEECISLFISIR
eukprot:jgi/Orpsp1_1/1175803/evm.model.c7180000055260.1